MSLGEAFAARAPGGATAAEWFARDLATSAARHVPGIVVEASARGPAGPGYLLPGLCDALASGAIEAAVVGGAHSDYDPRAIAALCAADRVFRSDNLDALIPGEAAAFAVLMRPDVARRLRLRPCGRSPRGGDGVREGPPRQRRARAPRRGPHGRAAGPRSAPSRTTACARAGCSRT